MTAGPTLPSDFVPRLRGTLHAWSVVPAVAAAIVLVALAREDARLAVAVYGTGLCALFGGSALYHRWPGPPRFKPILRRIDHSTIYLFIAGSYTPFAVELLAPGTRTVTLVVVWAGAMLGVLLSVAWIDAPRWLAAATYLALGWVGMFVVVEIFRSGGTAAGVLVCVGGLLYSVGAAAYATARPNPWPESFGFHEVFHVFVTLAAIVHYVAIAIVVL